MRVYTIGGYNEVGKNMTAVEVDDEIVIFDMGYNMEKVVQHNDEMESLSLHEIMDVGAIPNDKIINNQRKKVKAIVVNHGHLDHCGAVPFLANAYDCPIITPPYSADMIRKFISENRKKTANEIIELSAGETYTISEQLEVEFIHITHSIPDTVLSLLRTKDGNVLYANDFKLDDSPTFGEKPDYQYLKKIAKEGVKLFIPHTVHIFDEGQCPSESEARTQLNSSFRRIEEMGRDGLIIGTTFASNVARLRNFLDLNNDRSVIFLGRSLYNYLSDAEKRGYIDLSPHEIYSRGKAVSNALKKATEEKDKYLVLCTGNQGEPNSILRRIAEGRLHAELNQNDSVIFSCETIPVQANLYNRYLTEQMLSEKGVHMVKDVHASGHAYRDDHIYMLKLLQPEHVIPSHGDADRLASYARLAREEGYRLNETVHIGQNGNVISLD